MIKEPRNLLWVMPLICLLSFPFWKPIAAKLLSPADGVGEQADSVVDVSQGVRSGEMFEIDFTQARGDRKEWQIRATRMYSLEDDKDIMLENVEALFLGKSDKDEGQTSINSQKAKYNADSQLLNLHGQVVIRDNRGYEIRTESLNFLEKEKKIKTDSKVKINGSNIAVTGESLMYDIVSGNYRLEGSVVCNVW
jgi:LPS export ABC transporter protein LptC